MVERLNQAKPGNSPHGKRNVSQSISGQCHFCWLGQAIMFQPSWPGHHGPAILDKLCRPSHRVGPAQHPRGSPTNKTHSMRLQFGPVQYANTKSSTQKITKNYHPRGHSNASTNIHPGTIRHPKPEDHHPGSAEHRHSRCILQNG